MKTFLRVLKWSGLVLLAVVVGLAIYVSINWNNGWIEVVRKNFDHKSYTIRFTPRKSKSHWSRVNIKRGSELKALGSVHASGIAAFEKRDEGRTINYSYELRAADLGDAYERRFKSDAKAWAFFKSRAPSYQRLAKFWVTSAKKEETRDRRFARLMVDSAAGRRLSIATPGKRKSARLGA